MKKAVLSKLAPICAFILFTALSLGGVAMVDHEKKADLNDAAFAAWLAENDRHRLFDNMTDARKAWSFVVYMSHYLENRENDRERYENFLRKWNIGDRKAESRTSL